MILGLGIDLVEIERIRRAYDRFGERFLARVLVKLEIDYCLSQKDPAPSIAARFAAKEAVSKALGTGIGLSLGWQDIEIKRLASGMPTVGLTGAGAALMSQWGARSVHLSLTHTATHAAAVAVVES